MGQLRRDGARNVVLIDLGKNIYAFHRAAARVGLNILAIADDRFCATGRWYRGTPLLTLEDALTLKPDAFVVSNTSHVHAAQRVRELERRGVQPVHAWFLSPSGLSSDNSSSMPTSSSCGMAPTAV